MDIYLFEMIPLSALLVVLPYSIDIMTLLNFSLCRYSTLWDLPSNIDIILSNDFRTYVMTNN